MSTTTGIPPRNWIQEAFILLVPAVIIPAFFMLLRKSRSEPNPYIYERLGLRGESNLRDEEDAKYLGTRSSSSDSQWKVKAILCHPIKSCGDIELDTAKIEGAGILWDRKFVIAEWVVPSAGRAKPEAKSQPHWKFQTLRAPGYENLALVKPEIWLRKGSETDGLLIVRYPFIPSGLFASAHRLLMTLKLRSATTFFQVPLTPPDNHDYPRENVEIWKDEPVWLNYGRHVPESLRTLVKAKGRLTLFRVDPASYREVHGNAPTTERVGYQPVVGTADSYPLSVQNLASVRAIAQEVRREIPQFSVRRLRPNLIVTGGPSFDEDDWQRVRIGGHEIYCSCHTTRCKLPCVDPDTAIRHPSQPEQVSRQISSLCPSSADLSQYLRKNRNIDEGAPNKGCLGLQMVPATNQPIEIKVGDTVEILERGKHYSK